MEAIEQKYALLRIWNMLATIQQKIALLEEEKGSSTLRSESYQVHDLRKQEHVSRILTKYSQILRKKNI